MSDDTKAFISELCRPRERVVRVPEKHPDHPQPIMVPRVIEEQVTIKAIKVTNAENPEGLIFIKDHPECEKTVDE